jgi:hypothetical protein
VRPRRGAVGIATGYELDDGGFAVRVSVRSNISLLHVVQTGSADHQARRYQETLSLGIKRPKREANHLPLISTEVKKT